MGSKFNLTMANDGIHVGMNVKNADKPDCDQLRIWLQKTGSRLKSHVTRSQDNNVDRNNNNASEDNRHTLLQFSITLPLAELLDYDANLWNIAVTSPKEFCEILSRVLYDQLLLTGRYGMSGDQLHVQVNPKFEQLPCLPEYTIDRFFTWSINKYRAGGLFKLTGVVVAKSLIMKFTQFATYTCPNEACDLYKHIAATCLSYLGSSEHHIVRLLDRNDLTCPICEENLEEMISRRIIGERILVKILICNAIDSISYSRDGIYSHLVTASIKGPQDEKLEIGRKYSFTGVFVEETNFNWYSIGKQATMLAVFDVSHIKEIKNALSLPNLTANITSLHQDRERSPWSFVASLGYCFAALVCPSGIFNELKLCLLLSLVIMGDSPYSLPKGTISRLSLSLLICNQELSIIQDLMKYASKFNISKVCLQNSINVDGQFSYDESQPGAVYLEGGALALSGDGLCLIPNLSAVKKPVQSKIQKALELGHLPIPLKRKLSNESGYNHVNINVNCTIWCGAENQKKNMCSISNIETDCYLSKALADQFSLVLQSDDGDDDLDNEIHTCIVNQIIEKSSTDQSPKLLLTHEDFESLIDCARRLPVSMPQNVYDLINAFYLSSRRLRGTSIKGTEISRNALQTMLSLAVAHAKLSLRKEVLVEDATIAILLYENSISRRYGSSVLGISSSPHIKSSELELNLGPQNDVRLRFLQNHVINFCKSHLGSVPTSNTLLRYEE